MESPTKPLNGKRFLIQAALFTLLLGADVWFGWQLVSLFSVPTDQVNAAVAALYGMVIGAVTTSIGLGAKDLFNPDD